MDIEEIKEHKGQFELFLREVIQGSIIQFTEKTGYYPVRIDVELIDTTCMGDSTSEHVVGAVKVKLDLGL